jgi:hypothetical protein
MIGKENRDGWMDDLELFHVLGLNCWAKPRINRNDGE